MTHNNRHIKINIASQQLCLLEGDTEIMQVNISTAAKGVGETRESGCTPRGHHYIRTKIGQGSQRGAVFVGRRLNGEIYTAALARQYPDRDWILTRILWLCGSEPGKNRLGDCDTMQRYIYIHGTPDEMVLGQPGSHGCIRMNNDDIMHLFDLVDIGTSVEIRE